MLSPIFKARTGFYLILMILFCNLYTEQAKAQTNPCGVVASIYPATADSVVPAYTTVNFISTSTNATSVKWLYNGQSTGLIQDYLNPTFVAGVYKISLVAYKDGCTDTATVAYFSPGIAHDIDTTVFSQYGQYNLYEEGVAIDKTPDSGYVLAGIQNRPGSLCGEAGLVVKLREKGCIDWSKRFISPFYCTNSSITNIHVSADTSYYVVTNNVELAKLDKNGNLLWNKRYLHDDGFFNYTLGYAHITTDDEGIYLLGGAYFNGWTLTKLDLNGNFLWSKIFRLSYIDWNGVNGDYMSVTGLVSLNGKLYVSGSAFRETGGPHFNFNFLTKLDPVTGNKEWQKGYVYQESPETHGFTQLTTYGNMLMVAGVGPSVVLIDQSGNIQKNIEVTMPHMFGFKSLRASADSKGNIYVMYWTEEPLPLQPLYQYHSSVVKIDTLLNKYWGISFTPFFSRGSYFKDGKVGLDDKFALIGTNTGFELDGFYNSSDMWFFKTDTLIDKGICFNAADFSVAEKPIIPYNFNYSVDSSFKIIEGQATPYVLEDAFVGARYTCPDMVDSCSFMKISGPADLCNVNNTYTYRLHRNKKCILMPQWKLPAGVSIVSQTDSTISLRFAGFGKYTIAATLQSCIPVKDSIFVSIAPKTAPLNIGKDTVLCAGTNLMLNASKNFFDYTWNDGSKNSELTVTQPGIYWVDAVDGCSNTFRDSIVVSPYNVSVGIGPDRIKCNTDTLHLNAPSGFISYTWSNNYNISNTSSQQVVVNPLIDTFYYVKAEKLPGCFAYDTVKVSVLTSPSLQLGTDLSFCKGDSAVLKIPAGFNSVLWSTNALSQTITVYQAGTYSVIGEAPNGCKSYDTIKVLNVWNNPVVKLDPNPGLCIGDTRILSPGVFSSYKWQDGSTGPSFAVNSLGTYYVTVSDNNQCKASDTVRIVNALPLPTSFLPADTLICNYGTLQIKPLASFKNYLWNDNSNQPSLTIKSPGMYWLKATDINNCVGRDSIIINPKECLYGLYVPTAFTPNGDGRNDIFKPVVGGVLKKYEFSVYNRWGETVFTTRDIYKGWDGTIRGSKQVSDVFIWACTYELEGQPVKTEKGTVVLIH